MPRGCQLVSNCCCPPDKATWDDFAEWSLPSHLPREVVGGLIGWFGCGDTRSGELYRFWSRPPQLHMMYFLAESASDCVVVIRGRSSRTNCSDSTDRSERYLDRLGSVFVGAAAIDKRKDCPNPLLWRFGLELKWFKSRQIGMLLVCMYVNVHLLFSQLPKKLKIKISVKNSHRNHYLSQANSCIANIWNIKRWKLLFVD